jgi:hypothetical protein
MPSGLVNTPESLLWQEDVLTDPSSFDKSWLLLACGRIGFILSANNFAMHFFLVLLQDIGLTSLTLVGFSTLGEMEVELSSFNTLEERFDFKTFYPFICQVLPALNPSGPGAFLLFKEKRVALEFPSGYVIALV